MNRARRLALTWAVQRNKWWMRQTLIYFPGSSMLIFILTSRDANIGKGWHRVRARWLPAVAAAFLICRSTLLLPRSTGRVSNRSGRARNRNADWTSGFGEG